MSSITVIKIQHNLGFVDLECLEKSLEKNKFYNQVTIQQLAGKYTLSMSQRATNSQSSKIRAELEKQMEIIIAGILPDYVRFLSIKDFEAKKFSLKREKQESDGLLLVFERTKSLKDGGEFERLLVKIRDDNTVTIDAVNFAGRKCLDTTKSFENKVGKVIKRDMKPESKVKTSQNDKTRDRQQLRI